MDNICYYFSELQNKLEPRSIMTKPSSCACLIHGLEKGRIRLNPTKSFHQMFYKRLFPFQFSANRLILADCLFAEIVLAWN